MVLHERMPDGHVGESVGLFERRTSSALDVFRTSRGRNDLPGAFAVRANYMSHIELVEHRVGRVATPVPALEERCKAHGFVRGHGGL